VTVASNGGLSGRERGVAMLAATGMSSRAIALRLCISERTVENHLQRVYAKLAVHRRAELIARIVSGYELP
jgi:DNA-binding CsgD family transcriptional regulator